MKLLVSARNMLSHEYGEVKARDVEDFIERINVVREFVAALSKKY